MSGAEWTKSMSLSPNAPADAYHYLKRWSTCKEFSEHFRKPGNVSVTFAQPTVEGPESTSSNAGSASTNGKVTRAPNSKEIVLDLVGVDCAIANALRRVMLNDVATMAVEKVMFRQNNGVMQDEKLAHRLGLIPILADPADFGPRPGQSGAAHATEATEADTLVFELDVQCAEEDVDRQSENTNQRFKTIYSKDLRWIPHGSQAERFAGREPRPVHDDIIITRLGVGHHIHATCFVQRGIGFEHAKWQPATTYYRQLPIVKLITQVDGEQATLWKNADVANVFDLVDDPEASGGHRLVVARPRNCTMAKNFLLLPRGRETLSLERKEDHFIFTVEPNGQLSAKEVFLRSIQELKAKASTCIAALDATTIVT